MKKARRSVLFSIQKIISMPTRIPVMVEKAGSLLWYIRMD